MQSLLQILFVVHAIKISLGQSCGPRMSPRLLLEIPCDMSKNFYCNSPGSAYPWSSVKRYIYENQGFMRRMYGDLRQSVVVRNEIDETRERYDSIYYYGRGRAHADIFSPRSFDEPNIEPHVSRSTTTSNPKTDDS